METNITINWPLTSCTLKPSLHVLLICTWLWCLITKQSFFSDLLPGYCAQNQGLPCIFRWCVTEHYKVLLCLCWIFHPSALTGYTLSIGIGLPITGVGVAGGAAVHTAQQGAQVAHRHLLYEGGPIFPEIPPLKYLREKQRQKEIFFFKLIWHLFREGHRKGCLSSKKLYLTFLLTNTPFLGPMTIPVLWVKHFEYKICISSTLKPAFFFSLYKSTAVQ